MWLQAAKHRGTKVRRWKQCRQQRRTCAIPKPPTSIQTIGSWQGQRAPPFGLNLSPLVDCCTSDKKSEVSRMCAYVCVHVYVCVCVCVCVRARVCMHTLGDATWCCYQIVPSLKAPGFCSVYGSFASGALDLSTFGYTPGGAKAASQTHLDLNLVPVCVV